MAGALARALSARGFDVTWLSTDASAPPADVRSVALGASNFTERRLGFPWPLPGPGGLGTLWRAVREVDVVLAHDALYAVNIAAFLAARRFGKPFVLVQHVGEVPYANPLLRLLMQAANLLVARPILRGADQVVFISRVTGDHFAGLRFRRPPQYVFNGVDHAVFAPATAERKADLRRRFDLPADRKTALFAGRFVEKKGLGLLQRAAAARPDILWAFAGWGAMDPASWGLPNVRVFTGLSGDSLADLYRAADLLVLPSVGEGFPLVIQEALACGLPVVCGAETTRADEAAAPWLTGVELSGDAETDLPVFSRAVDAALATAEEGAEGRVAFVRRRYSWEAGADRYAEILRGLASASLR